MSKKNNNSQNANRYNNNNQENIDSKRNNINDNSNIEIVFEYIDRKKQNKERHSVNNHDSNKNDNKSRRKSSRINDSIDKKKKKKREDYKDNNIDKNTKDNKESKKKNSGSSKKVTKDNNKVQPIGDKVNKENNNKQSKHTNNVNNAKNNNKHSKSKTKKKKRFSIKQKLLIFVVILLCIILIIGMVFGVYVFKANGNVKDAVLNMATDIVGEQDPIFVLILGISSDISIELTDTIMLCGYNPHTQKAFMISIPRDTFVGKNPNYADGYDKINAQYQTSAEKTVEAVELLTGIHIDYYAIVRNVSITSIFECIGSIDFDVPIDMNYDDPTQDLHIHLKKGFQTLEPNQIEQLLRFRHNNNGTSYPSSYGDNDYGRMRTQREFIKATIDQVISIQNVGKLKDTAAMVYTNLQTSMSGFTVLDYVPHVLKFKTSDLRSEQLPGQSEMINNLWFYKANKKESRKLCDELMIYLELEDNELEKSYKFASEIKGIKPDVNEVDTDTNVVSNSVKNKTTKKTNTANITTTECQHDYSVVVSERDSTCTKTGSEVRKCKKCKDKNKITIPEKGHNFVNGVCKRCKTKDPDYVSPKANTTKNTKSNNNTVKKDENVTTDKTKEQAHVHKYTTKIESSEVKATCKTPGNYKMQCSCGATKTEVVNVLGHDYKNGICTRCYAVQQNYKPEDDTEKKDKEDQKTTNSVSESSDNKSGVNQTTNENKVN